MTTQTQSRPTYRINFLPSNGSKPWCVQRLCDAHRGDAAWYSTEKAFASQLAAKKYMKAKGA